MDATNPPAIPPPRPRFSRPLAVLLSVVVMWLAVLLVAFAITGTLLTVTVFLLPVLTVLAILYMVWSTRRRRRPAA